MSGQQRRARITRDGVLFATGLLGIIYETLVAHGDRPTLLVLFGAMVGLPAFLRSDEKGVRLGLPPPPPPAPAPPTAAAPEVAPEAEGGG